MKKIVLAIENFSPFAGGAESYAVALASTLVQNGWEVHLFVETWEGEPGSVVFHRISIPKWLPAWARILIFALKHRGMVRRQDFDVVLGFGNTIAMNVYQSHGGVHRFSTLRKVYSENHMILRIIKRVLIAFSIKQWVRNWIETAPFRQDQRPKIVAISHLIKKDMASFCQINEAEIKIVYNGVDTTQYNSNLQRQLRGPLRQHLGIPEHDVIFLFISYDLKKKGILPLVDAAAILKQTSKDRFKILVVGGSPYPSLLKRIKKKGLTDTIIFTGQSRSIKEFYGNADVFVLPTYYDACSLVVIEAMASGLPSITTVYNGAAGIITNGEDGYIISHPPEPMELEDRMRSLMAPETREQMSKKAMQTAKKYSIERNHQEMIKVFNEVAKPDSVIQEATSFNL